MLLLEDLLNLNLFNRSHNATVLTRDGETLVRNVSPLLENIQEPISQPQGEIETLRGVIKIGISKEAMSMMLTAIVRREGSGYVSLCPELDIAGQGDNVEQARDNLREAPELFFETASSDEIKRRLQDEVFVTQVEVAVG